MPKLTGKEFVKKVANSMYGDHLLGWPFNISLTVIATYMHLIGSPDLGRHDLGLRIITVIVSHAVLLLGINLSYHFCRFVFGNSTAPYWFIATLPFIGAARGFTIQYSLFEFRIVNHEDFVYRMVSSALILPIAVAFLGYLIGITAQWKRTSEELRASHRKLSVLLNEAELKSESELTEDLGFIKSELMRGLQASSVKKNEELIATLTNLVSDVLKPMSAQLVSASPLPAMKETELAEAKFQGKSLFKYLSLGNACKPWPITVFLIVTYLPVVVRFEGVVAALQTVAVTIGVVTPILLLLQKISKYVDKLKPALRIPLILVLLSLAEVPFGLLLPMLVDGGSSLDLLPLQALVTIELLGVSIGLGGAIDTEVRRVLTDLKETAQKIRWRTAHLYSTHWFNKRQFARKLHGPVQAEVLASIVRLESEPDLNRATAWVKNNIASKLMGILSAPRVELNPTAVLNEIAETWDGICQIQVHITTEAEALCASDQVAAETVLEIIREACSNAIHHGKAGNIEICVGVEDRDCISLEVTDDGAGSLLYEGAGMGSRHLVECTVSHSLANTPEGTRLNALIPVLAI